MRPIAMGTSVVRIADVLDALSRAEQRGYQIADLELGIGFEAFVELVYLAAGELEPDVADEHPMIAALRTERRRAREERIRSGLRSWGKPGSSLFGVPIRADAELEGWELHDTRPPAVVELARRESALYRSEA